MIKFIKEFWLDLLNKKDENGFSKEMRKAKRKLEKIKKQSKKRKDKFI